MTDTHPTGRSGLFRQIPRTWLVAGGGWVGRALTVAAQLLAVRLLTDTLGTEMYGVFAVLASLLGWFALSDFGIPISLQNHISERRANNAGADDLIVCATLMIAGFSFATGIALLLVGPWLARLLLGEFHFLSADEKVLAFWAIAYPALGTALGGTIYRIWFAQHRGYLSHLLPAFGTLLGAFGVWGVAQLQPMPLLSWSAVVYYGPLALLPLAALMRLLVGIPRGQSLPVDLIWSLLRRAFQFWVFAILAALVLQVDYIILAQVLTATDIVIYNVATKVFLLIFFLYNAFLTALWPVCSEAIAQSRWDTVFTTMRRYLALGTLITVCGTAGFALFNEWLTAFLVPATQIRIPLEIIGLLGGYTLVRVWTDSFAMILQSMNDLRIFWIVVPVQSALSVGLQIAGASLFGLPGMIVGLTGCFLLTVAWILPWRCVSHARH